MNTTTTTNGTEELAAAVRAGIGRSAAVAISTAGGLTYAAAADDQVTVEVIADATAGEPDGTSGPAPVRLTPDAVTAGAQFPGRCLRQIVAAAVPATDTESSRYALGGTLVEVAEGSTLNVIGTDGRRMHCLHLQPSHMTGQAAVIVHAGQWQAFAATVRAAVRRVFGSTGRKLDATIDRGSFTIDIGLHRTTGGSIVRLAWTSAAADPRLTVRAEALALEGRFPRWLDVLTQMPSIEAGGMPIDADAVAAAVAEFRGLHRAAEKAGRDAWMAEPLPAGARKRKAGEYRHDRGVFVSAEGMVGRGCDWSSAVPAAPRRVCLDPRFLADALDGAAAIGKTVEVFAGRETQPAVIVAGGHCGERLVAVLMPMLAD